MLVVSQSTRNSCMCLIVFCCFHQARSGVASSCFAASIKRVRELPPSAVFNAPRVFLNITSPVIYLQSRLDAEVRQAGDELMLAWQEKTELSEGCKHKRKAVKDLKDKHVTVLATIFSLWTCAVDVRKWSWCIRGLRGLLLRSDETRQDLDYLNIK